MEERTYAMPWLGGREKEEEVVVVREQQVQARVAHLDASATQTNKTKSKLCAHALSRDGVDSRYHNHCIHIFR